MYRAIIVEDEALASQYLKNLIDVNSDINVIDQCDTGKAAIQAINKSKPDLVFLDIHLPDVSGFEVLKAIDYSPLIVFTTAYEKYAIKAFEAFCVDYLVKPITTDRFIQTVNKLNRVQAPPTFKSDDLSRLLDEIKDSKKISSIAVTIGDKIILIDCSDITHLKGEDKYVRLFTKSGKSHLSSKTLNNLESSLPNNFIRAHRSYIANRDYIVDIRKYFKGRLMLRMNDSEGTSITTSSQYTEQVKVALGLN